MKGNAFTFKNKTKKALVFVASTQALDASISQIQGGLPLYGYHVEDMLVGTHFDIWRMLTMTKRPLCIQDTNLSQAWAQAFLEAVKPGVKEILPLVVTVTGFVDSKPVVCDS